MVRYSLSPQEHEIKRGLRRIQREIKQNVFVDIPIDYEHIFDTEFHVRLANCKEPEGDQDTLIINGDIVDLKEGHVNSHKYEDGNQLFYISQDEMKEMLERYSITLAEDLRKILLAVLPTSVRQLPMQEYAKIQHKFFDTNF